MWSFIFDSIWGWIGIAGVVVIAAAVVGYFIPSLRLAMLAVAGSAITIAGAYTKGDRNRAALEKRRQDEAVRKVKEKYDEIDRNPTTDDDLARRLRDGSF